MSRGGEDGREVSKYETTSYVPVNMPAGATVTLASPNAEGSTALVARTTKEPSPVPAV